MGDGRDGQGGGAIRNDGPEAEAGVDGGQRPVRRRTIRRDRWTTAMREMFLDHLAATCSIDASADAVGADPAGAYHLRRTDPAFVAAWGKALALGYEVLETQLVGHALAGGVRAITGGTPRPTGRIDVDLALRLIAARRIDRTPRRDGRQGLVAAAQDTDDAILRKLDRMEKRRARDAGGAARSDARQDGPA